MALVGATANASVIVDENFDAGQGSWVKRANPLTSIAFTGGAVNINPQANTQPNATNLSFDAVTLQDGETLRMTVDISTTDALSDARNLRIGQSAHNGEFHVGSGSAYWIFLYGSFRRECSGSPCVVG
ncbi:MAG: hypothetical protein K9M54_13255 [Kiritimatiellales bacterium]|nr:hypothetical protein [Kiritimatiellales bacterium]